MRRAVVTYALLAVAFVAAGCGTDDSLSHAELVKAGNAICKPYNEKAKAIIKNQRPNTPADEIASELTKVADLADELDTELSDLDPSGDDADALNAAIQLQAKQGAQIRKAAGQLRDGDLEGGKATAQAVDKQTPALNEAFDDLGLTECGSSGGN